MIIIWVIYILILILHKRTLRAILNCNDKNYHINNMATEIEHKYLVINDDYKNLAFKKVKIRQGYLNRSPDRTVRIRTVDEKGYLTIKGRNKGDSRLEFEYEIPYSDALHIFQLAEPGIVTKTRYLVKYDSLIWEVD